VDASVIVAVVVAEQVSAGLAVKVALPPITQVELVKFRVNPAEVLL
jgi:hypothetical protein